MVKHGGNKMSKSKTKKEPKAKPAKNTPPQNECVNCIDTLNEHS